MRKILMHIFTIADYEEEEVWLRNQHKKGWKLVKIAPPCFYIFESCKPQDVIYRLDYKKRKKEKEDYMQMVEDFGWEYLDDCVGWLYFRKAKDEINTKEEGELFSDNRSKAEFANNIIKKRMVPLCLIFFMSLACYMCSFFSVRISGEPWTFLDILSLYCVVSSAVLFIYCGAKLKKLKNKYQNSGY